MKKAFLAVLRMLVLGALMMPILSCEGDEPQAEVEVIPTITVPQGYKNYFSSSGSSGMSFDSSASENVVVFQTNVDWDISISNYSYSTSWCNVSTDSGEAGLHKLKVSVKKNNNGEYRKATIWVKHGSKGIGSIDIQQKCDDAIDLGLSVKWASRNVGASSPTGHGGFYAWGETEEKDDYSWETYSLEDVNLRSICGTDYDVAHVKWGDGWRMPTYNEMSELLDCSRSNYGDIRIIGPNGNFIILPSQGYRDGKKLCDIGLFYFNGYYDPWRYINSGIWSGAEYRDGYGYLVDYANAICVYSNGILGGKMLRYLGFNVRPVKE